MLGSLAVMLEKKNLFKYYDSLNDIHFHFLFFNCFQILVLPERSCSPKTLQSKNG